MQILTRIVFDFNMNDKKVIKLLFETEGT